MGWFSRGASPPKEKLAKPKPSFTLEVHGDQIHVLSDWPEGETEDECVEIAHQIASLAFLANTGGLLQAFRDAISSNPSRFISDVAREMFEIAMDDFQKERARRSRPKEDGPVVPPTSVFRGGY